MPSTYTLNNGIELIGTGEQSGTWGDTTNTNFSLLDTALDGQVSVTLSSAGSSGSPNNLPVSDGSASNGRNRMVTFVAGSDLGATAFVQLTPNDSEKIIYVRNSLSGSRSIIMFQGTYNSSNDYAIPAGKTAVIYFDGAGSGAVAANVFNNAHFDALNVVGNVTVGGDVTVTGTVDAATVEFNNLSGTGSVSVTDILDQDDMSSNSATALATQQSIKAYVDSQVDTVDTLAEILAVGNTTGGTDLAVSTGDDITFADGSKATFGAGNDLQISHDGNNSIIDEVGTGNLFIRGTTVNIQHIDSNPNESMIKAVANGTVTLSHNGSEKIATTATGVAVTGNIAATGNVSGVNGTFTGDVTIGDDLFITGPNPVITLTDNDVADEFTKLYNISGNTFLDSRNGTANGAIVFRGFGGGVHTEYARFIAGGNFGIGDTGPSEKLSVTGNIAATGNVTAVDGTFTGDVYIRDDLFVTGPTPVITLTDNDAADENTKIQNNNGNTFYTARNGAANGQHVFQQNAGGTITEAMRISASGNVGLGVTNPTEKLHVAGNAIVSGDVTIGDDLFLTGPNPKITMTDTDVASEYGEVYHSGGNNFYTARDGAANGQHIFYQNAGGTITEPMRIDENGRLGLGVQNPTEKLHVAGNGTFTGDVTAGGLTVDGIISTTSGTDIDMDASASGQLKLDGNGYGGAIALNENGMNIYTNSAFRDVIFGTNETERMRIDGSGNVGIGSSAPAAMLYVGGNNTILGGTAGNDINLLTLHADTSNNDFLQFTSERLTTGTNWTTAAHRIQRKVDAVLMGYMQFGRNDADLVTFGEGTTEYMRIDGSGNVLVGKTSSDFNTQGFEINSGGQLRNSRASGSVAFLNRKTDDGNILDFGKDGNVVGSIGTSGGDLDIGTGDTTIRFNDGIDSIFPVASVGGSGRDNAVDLGFSGARFKDLYLSSGVYLGGTVAANKLDDYEEGTWTPVVRDASSAGNTATVGTMSGTYTKVGNMVTVWFQAMNINKTGMTAGNVVFVTGLPFAAVAKTNTFRNTGAVEATRINFTNYLVGNVEDGAAAIVFRDVRDSLGILSMKVQDITTTAADLFVTITYETT